MSTEEGQTDDYSDAALSVYRVLAPEHVTDTWSGEPYAIQVTRTDGSLAWHVATEDEASAHGRWFGWDQVAAIVAVGSTAH